MCVRVCGDVSGGCVCGLMASSIEPSGGRGLDFLVIIVAICVCLFLMACRCRVSLRVSVT